MVDALIEQDGVDLSGGLVGKTRRASPWASYLNLFPSHSEHGK